MNGNLKSTAIRDTLKKTRERRKSQICRQYEVKIDRSHLNEESKQLLNRIFLEAQWFYNSILGSQHIFDLPKDHYKTEQVQYNTRWNNQCTSKEGTNAKKGAEICPHDKEMLAMQCVERNEPR